MKVDWNEYTTRIKSATGTDSDLLRQIGIGKGAVLDIGCGIGKHLSVFDDSMLRVGIDAGFSGLQKGKLAFADLSLICGDVYHLPIRSEAFNTVITLDVIEHLEEPVNALIEIFRVLKPNGKLFIQTPNYPIKRLYDLWHWIRRTRDGFQDDPTHVSKFTCRSLMEAVSRAGFVIELVKARNVFFQEYIHVLDRMRETTIWRTLGQKSIIIAQRPSYE